MTGRRRGGQTIAALVAVTFTLLSASVVWCQDTSGVQASVDRDVVRVGDTLSYTLRISANRQVAMSLLTQPGFGPFVVQGTSQGTEMRSGRGHSQFVRTVTARLRASKKGKFTIAGPSAKVAGRVLQGNSVEVEVLAAGAKAPALSPSQRRVPILLRVTPDDVRPFVGEQVLVEYALYQDQASASPFGAEVTNATEPAFDGLWIEDLTKTLSGRNRYETLGSKSYTVSPIKLLAVFPLNPGPLEVEPMEIEVNMGRILRRKSVRLASDSFALDVRPLPKPMPEGFSEANVGRYQLAVKTDKKRVAVGEPLTVTLVVKGTGMTSRVVLPTLPELPAFRALDPVVDKETHLSLGRVHGTKSAQIVLTPLKTGAFEIPALDFHYFDPDEETYTVASSSPIRIAVAGDWGKTEHDEDLIERTETNVPAAVQVAREPLAPVRALDALPPRPATPKAPVTTHPLFLLGLLVPPFSYSGWLLAGLLRRRRQAGSGARSQRDAPKNAAARLAIAAGHIEGGRTADAMDEVNAALTELLAVWMGVPKGAVSRSRLRRFLSEQGVDPELIEGLEAIRSRCDEARFGGVEAALAGETVKQARDWVDVLASQLGGKP